MDRLQRVCSVATLLALCWVVVANAETVAYFRFEDGSDGAGAVGPVPPSVDNVIDTAGGDDNFRAFSEGAAPEYVADVPVATIPLTGATNMLSLSFDGSDDLYQDIIGPIRTMVFADFTVEAWVRFDSLTGFQTVVGRDDMFGSTPGQNGTPASLFYLTKASDNHFRVELTDAANGQVAVESSVFATTGAWYHLAAVGDATAGTLELFINGLSAGVNTDYTGLYDPGNDDTWTIGRGQYQSGVADTVLGSIDEVRWSDEALDPTQFLPAYAPPVTWDGDASNLWSVAANWSDDTLPVFTGFTATPVFAASGAAGGALNNDVADVELAGIRFNSQAPAFDLGGNPIAVSGAITNYSNSLQNIALEIEAVGQILLESNEDMEISGRLVGTSGFRQGGIARTIVSNGTNSVSGPINFDGTGSLVVTATGALGDPDGYMLLNAYYHGPLGILELNGGVTQGKVMEFGSRAIGDPPHIISTNGVNTLSGAATAISGGNRYIIAATTDSTLNFNVDFDMTADSQSPERIIRCDGEGTININGNIVSTSPAGTGIGIGHANGAAGVLNINGMKDHNGSTAAFSGTVAFVDPTSSNNVPNSATIRCDQPDGVMDFSGLMGGGIVLNGNQTLVGSGEFIGSVATSDGSVLSPGTNAVDTMTLPSLSLAGGTEFDFQLAPDASDMIAIASGGTVTGPSSGTVHINLDFSNGAAESDYVIMDWTGASAIDLDASDFTADVGTVSIVGSQLLLTISFESQAQVLVSDTGNDRVLRYNVTQFGTLSPDPDNPVFAEGTVGEYPLLFPVGMATDSAGNVYIAEGATDSPPRIMKFDSDGNYIEDVAEVFPADNTPEFNGTPAHLVIDPTDTYLYASIAQPNDWSTIGDTDDVIYRVDLSLATPPAIVIDTTDTGGNYELNDPQGLAFGPDGYLYVGNNLPADSTSPDPGSRILRFDVRGSTGVYAGTVTTEHADIKGFFYDDYFDRLLVSLNNLNDIWAYTDLSQDFVANDPDAGPFEFIYQQDADVDYPDVVFAGGEVFFTDSTDDVIRRVVNESTTSIALGAGAGLVDPHSMVVLSDFGPFDLDRDGDVDVDDNALFVDALNGPGVTTPPVGVSTVEFDRADLDDDGDVDLRDAAIFMRAFGL